MQSARETQLDPSAAQNESALTVPESRGRRFSWGTAVAVAAVLGLLVIIGLMLQRTQQGPVTAGTTAPGFSVETFDGQMVQLADLDGRVVVINFWASWCKPCEQEAAELEQAYRMYQDEGVAFVGLNYVDTEPEAMAYLDRFGITYPNAPDLRTRVAQSYRIRGVPETFIVGPDGQIVYVKIGPFESLSEITAAIETALAQ